jgi:hypothetical protein
MNRTHHPEIRKYGNTELAQPCYVRAGVLDGAVSLSKSSHEGVSPSNIFQPILWDAPASTPYSSSIRQNIARAINGCRIAKLCLCDDSSSVTPGGSLDPLSG